MQDKETMLGNGGQQARDEGIALHLFETDGRVQDDGENHLTNRPLA